MLLTKQLLAFRPSRSDLIFAGKTFFACMLALYIAFILDLTYPMWAIGTVIIIANPYSGMVSSKCLYRLSGTFIGAAFAVLTTPYFIDTPWLFTLILSLWVGLCLYISMLDRTPRSYLFMLAGYTSVMVVCNAINNINSDSVFDLALGRVLEISVAVICSAVVSATVFPVHLGNALQQRLKKTLNDTDQLFLNLFHHNDTQHYTATLANINRDINELHVMAVHLSYEKGELQGMTKPIQELLHQFSLVLVNIVAISQRLAQLKSLDPQLWQKLQPFSRQISDFLQQKPDLSRQSINVLPQGFHQYFSQLKQSANHAQAKIVLDSLQMDIRHFIQNVYSVNFIWQLIQNGEKKLPEFIVPLTTAYPSLHRDTGMAMRGAIAACISTFASFAVWIYSGWQAGYMMAQLAAVSACILTALDNPVPALKTFIRASFYASVMVWVYVFFILPDVHSFWQLTLVLAPVLMYAICLIPHPPLTGLGLPFTINFIMSLNLQNHYQISAVPMIDVSLAGVVGPIISILALYFIRAISPEISAKRLLSAHYQAMQQAITMPFNHGLNIHIRSMLDRIGILSSKLVETQQIKQATNTAFVETCTVIDLARLQELKALDISADISELIEQIQSSLAYEFQLQQTQLSLFDPNDMIAMQLDYLQDLAQNIEHEDIRQRLLMCSNNIRYSICRHPEMMENAA